MSADTAITVVGNLTGDPDLRFTPSGAAVASFTIASTPRSFDRASNEWKNGETLFLRCSIWRQAAEHVGESLTRARRRRAGPAQAAQLRNQRGGHAHHRRARRRRGRSVTAVRHRKGQPQPAGGRPGAGRRPLDAGPGGRRDRLNHGTGQLVGRCRR